MNMFIVTCIYGNCIIICIPLPFIPPYIFLRMVVNIFQRVTSSGENDEATFDKS